MPLSPTPLPNFEGVQYFSPYSTDSWGDATKIDRGLLLKLDALRELIGAPIIITSGYRPNDTGSQHALGLALDIMSPEYPGSLYELYRAALGLDFRGLGVYPHWHISGNTIGGLHVDERLGRIARWMGVLENGKQQYIALTSENLTKYGVVG